MKIKKYSNIHYFAQCDTPGCEFNCGYSSHMSHAAVRARIRNHVLKTGHSVTLDTGSSITYSK